MEFGSASSGVRTRKEKPHKKHKANEVTFSHFSQQKMQRVQVCYLRNGCTVGSPSPSWT